LAPQIDSAGLALPGQEHRSDYRLGDGWLEETICSDRFPQKQDQK
jgi:hypothetical protein